ncbi:MAG: hypothetical protein GX639_15865 [Fibrobacter sp.]|nr:hypothetical protein [Fibrobacter sp.]
MKTYFFTIITFVAVIIIPVAAQSNSGAVGDPNGIFSTMMQTMPSELKMRIDSASHSVSASHMVKDSSGIFKNSDMLQKIEKNSADAGIDKLPEAIRTQVLKTMQEIETDKQKRMLEFKEAKGIDK